MVRQSELGLLHAVRAARTRGSSRSGSASASFVPGEPNCMYHGEGAQEDFLVLSGECLLVIEGEERRLKRGTSSTARRGPSTSSSAPATVRVSSWRSVRVACRGAASLRRERGGAAARRRRRGGDDGPERRVRELLGKTCRSVSGRCSRAERGARGRERLDRRPLAGCEGGVDGLRPEPGAVVGR